MNAHHPPLPLPNPGDWCTRQAACHALQVSDRTLGRLIDDGILTAYRPVSGPTETPPVLLWAPEVAEVAAARRRLGKARQ